MYVHETLHDKCLPHEVVYEPIYVGSVVTLRGQIMVKWSQKNAISVTSFVTLTTPIFPHLCS